MKHNFQIIRSELFVEDSLQVVEEVIGKNEAVKRATALLNETRWAARAEGRKYAQYTYMILNQKTNKLSLPDGTGCNF